MLSKRKLLGNKSILIVIILANDSKSVKWPVINLAESILLVVVKERFRRQGQFAIYQLSFQEAGTGHFLAPFSISRQNGGDLNYR